MAYGPESCMLTEICGGCAAHPRLLAQSTRRAELAIYYRLPAEHEILKSSYCLVD